MDLIDIKKSINQVLKDNFLSIKIYPGDTKEGFQRPAFFTQVIPAVEEYETINYASSKMMIVINYFSENGTELENIKMYDELKNAFGMTLKVNHRSLLLKNISSETVDEVLQFKFDLDYFERTRQSKSEEAHDLMGDLKIKMRGER